MFRLELETPILYNNNQLVYSLELVMPFKEPEDEAFIINDKMPVTVARGKAILCEMVQQCPITSNIFKDNQVLLKLRDILIVNDEYTSEMDFKDCVNPYHVKTYEWNHSIAFNKETLELELVTSNHLTIDENGFTYTWTENYWVNLSDAVCSIVPPLTITHSGTDVLMRGETTT